MSTSILKVMNGAIKKKFHHLTDKLGLKTGLMHIQMGEMIHLNNCFRKYVERPSIGLFKSIFWHSMKIIITTIGNIVGCWCFLVTDSPTSICIHKIQWRKKIQQINQW